jgi:hypothetical protein
VIRPATADDMTALVAMGREFHAVSPYAGNIEFVSEDFAEQLTEWLSDHLVLVATWADKTVGFAVILRYPCYFNRSVSAHHEVMWWVAPEHRGAAGAELWNAIDEILMKAPLSIVSATAEMRGPAMDRLYRMRGFQLLDLTYMRVN